MKIDKVDMRSAVRRALQEDIGDGDRTAQLIAENRMAEASVVSRDMAVLCGQAWFDETFHQLDSRVVIQWQHQDGDTIAANSVVCTLRGPARALLTGERTALNFLQMLSGTASLTRRYVDAVDQSKARILDTRKTVPGLRRAQKYAVRCGGGHNHRIGLFDGILIKENHIQAAGSITAAVQAARLGNEGIFVEVEVETLTQLQEALDAGAERILLDNFSLEALREAVAVNAGQARLEASGGINLENVREIALTGVDDISIGELTKHVRAIDLSMRFGVNGPS